MKIPTNRVLCPTCRQEYSAPAASSLRARREAAGVSLRDLASYLGVSAQHLSTIERGHRHLGLAVIRHPHVDDAAVLAAYEALRPQERRKP